jgi:hypothetical protein
MADFEDRLKCLYVGVLLKDEAVLLEHETRELEGKAVNPDSTGTIRKRIGEVDDLVNRAMGCGGLPTETTRTLRQMERWAQDVVLGEEPSAYELTGLARDFARHIRDNARAMTGIDGSKRAGRIPVTVTRMSAGNPIVYGVERGGKTEYHLTSFGSTLYEKLMERKDMGDALNSEEQRQLGILEAVAAGRCDTIVGP